MLRCWLLAIFGCVAVRAQSAYYLPQIVDGPFGGGNAQSAILLLNPGSADASVNMQFTGDDASPLAINMPGLAGGKVTIKAGASAILRSDGASSGVSGAATINSSLPLVVSEVVSIYDTSGNLLTESSAADTNVISNGVIPVDTTGTLNTGVALLNPGAAGANLTFQLIDPTGSPVEKITATLAAGAHAARWIVGDLFPDIQNGFQGTLVISSSSPLRAIGLRQNEAAPSLALLTATAASTTRTSFILPQVADGPFAANTVQTSFLIYNVSAKPAKVSLALARDDGSPLLVNIPALGANSNFAFTLAPGAAAFMQTDGQGATGTGSALVRSDNAIGLAALVTASDNMGNFLSETAIGQPAAWPLWRAPVEITPGLDSVLTLVNPMRKAATVTVNLLDPAGKKVNTATLPPLAPGAHTTVSLGQLFSVTSGFAGSLTIASPVTTPGVAALVLRQDVNSPRFATAPLAIQPIPPNPLAITTKLDTAHAATTIISAATGGTLTATGADGSKYTLTVPANALTNDLAISMTPLTSASGLPFSGGLTAAVQFAPEGLFLFRPATLVVQPAKPIPATAAIVPVGWTGSGQNTVLAPIVVDKTRIALSILHFSGAGVGGGGGGGGVSGSDVNALSNYYGSEADNYNNQASQIANEERNSESNGNPPNPQWQQDLLNLLDQYYNNVIDPLIQTAMESGDPTLLSCAIQQALSWEHQREVAGSGTTFQSSPIYDKVVTMAQTLVDQEKAQCDKRDPNAATVLISRWRTYEMMTSDRSGEAAIIQEIAKCSPTFELDFNSEISGTASSGTTFDTIVQAKVSLPLKPSMEPGKLNVLTGSGSGPIAVTKFVTALDGKSIAPCTSSKIETPGTFTIYQNLANTDSGITYDVNLTQDPSKPAVGADGKAAFCQPVLPNANPVSVTMMIDPGKPMDELALACPGGAAVQAPWWITNWYNFHQSELTTSGGLGYGIKNWQIMGPSGGDIYAQKLYNNAITGKAPITENTTIQLKHVNAQTQ